VIRKNSIILGIFAALGMAHAAVADDSGIYVRADAGYAFSQNAHGDLDDDVGGSPVAGFGVGYRINPMFRVDATFNFRPDFDVDSTSAQPGPDVTSKADLHSMAAMANVYWDIAKIDRFMPYIGVGLGVAINKLSDVDLYRSGDKIGKIDGDDNTSFAWQVMAGTGVALDNDGHAILDFGYRYADMGRFEAKGEGRIGGTPVSVDASHANIRSHEIQIGLRYNF